MTTTVTLTQYLDAHRAWLKGGSKGGPDGYVEGPNNDTPFGRRFGLNHQPWCLMWAMCCAEDAGLPYGIRTAGTRYCAAWAKRNGILQPDPAPGALGLLFEGHKPGTGHAVVCEALRPGGWVSLEGNTDVRGGRTGGRCLRLARSMSAVGAGGGFIHREFAAPGQPAPLPKEDDDMAVIVYPKGGGPSYLLLADGKKLELTKWEGSGGVLEAIAKGADFFEANADQVKAIPAP